MGRNPQVNRFRINPAEVLILCVMVLIFLNSVYNLFYDWRQIPSQPSLAELNNTTSLESAGRSPAGYLSLEVECEPNSMTLQKVQATKVRLNGPLCGGTGSDSVKESPIQTEVLNTASHTKATVFTDPQSNRFLTDYLPLSPGKNPIEIRFTYQGGKVVQQTMAIVREEPTDKR